jgi:hypothetical protein
LRHEQEQELRHIAPVITLPIPDEPPHPSRKNNLFEIVATPKKTDSDNALDTDLIARTEQLLKDAKSGKLKGLGLFADYGSGYICGLEGSYLENPETAIVPLKILDRRIMDQVSEQD